MNAIERELAAEIESAGREVSEGRISQQAYNERVRLAEREARDAERQEREEAHERLDRDMGWL